jgi:hypothetical protein
MRYFIGFLISIGLIIILILLLLTGGGDSGQNNKSSETIRKPKTVKQLGDFASTSAVARLIIDGPINADQNHQAVRITVGQDDTVYEQIQGFEGTVVNQQNFSNNQSAYSNFLYAIGHAGFLLGDPVKALANEKGYCPLGNRYVFELIDGSDVIQRYWATSCGNPKTYKGNLSLTLDLFKAQVPGYNDLTQDLGF